MKKVKLLTKIKNAGIIAVIRANSANSAIKIADAVIAGGITGIELTFTVPLADKALAILTEKYANNNDVIIGAGTVLDSVSARIAILNGAQFIVSPSFNADVAKICNLYETPYTPGCLSPTEIQQALETGVDLVKIFPSNVISKNIISAVKGPFPYVSIMPTGGINLDNMEDWFKAGATVVGTGSNLIAGAKNNNFEQITQTARQYHDKLLEIKANI